MRRLRGASTIVLFLGALAAQEASLPPLRKAMDGLVGELGLEGAALSVVRADGELHRSVYGQTSAWTVMPIASASKWLAVATILTLVDDGTLDLDVPVARYLPELDRADKRTITLRQCLSCTAGFPATVPFGGRARDRDMKALIAVIADQPLHSNPGLEFRYGGVTFQVAACAAERATGKSWHELFAERIAAPLGMSATKFGVLLPPGAEAGTTKVPSVAGGAVSTLDEYSRFVRMLLGKGTFQSARVLSAASAAAMTVDQVSANAPVRREESDDRQVRYGLGTWLERIAADGAAATAAGGPSMAAAATAIRASDPGAFGFTPWLDLDLGIGGVLAVKDRVARVLPRLRSVQDAARAAARSPAVAGRDETLQLQHGGRDRRYRLHVPPRAESALALPLLVVLHGGGGTGEQAAAATGFAALADREGFVVAFPDGTGPLQNRLLTWNSGGIPVYAAEQKVDDVAFLKAVVADAARRVAIDPQRVYATGHSNGAMMCHRLAREAADVFAAVAAVSGAMDFTAADDETPISVLMIHGSADKHVPYGGGRPQRSVGQSGARVDASMADAIAYYRARDHLGERAFVREDGKVKTETWERPGPPGAARVRVITLAGGGHSWPGGPSRQWAGADEPFPFDATAAVWEFVRDARLQQLPRPVPR